jgi:hypothetical protein
MEGQMGSLEQSMHSRDISNSWLGLLKFSISCPPKAGTDVKERIRGGEHARETERISRRKKGLTPSATAMLSWIFPVQWGRRSDQLGLQGRTIFHISRNQRRRQGCIGFLPLRRRSPTLVSNTVMGRAGNRLARIQGGRICSFWAYPIL